jgi:[amino group carrier protein]-lysine/ornithine hydrolase
MPQSPLTQEQANELLRGLVAIPSLSRQEAAASNWLVAQMASLGYERAFVDYAGNAVGEIGAADALHTVVLLGHIDTVPGNIPVQVLETADGPLLYGRGSVDAKGPLATFVAAVARLGAEWAQKHNIRIVTVGAVEEEYATSKGARWIAARFDGQNEPIPSACVIGEPSSWQRLTLGYKGRLLVELTASQPMAHTAGPDLGVATIAVDLWNWVRVSAEQFNLGRDKAFDQLSPSLRVVNTHTDAAMQDIVTAQIGIRLPLDFDVDGFVQQLVNFMTARLQSPAPVDLSGFRNLTGLDPTNSIPLQVPLQGQQTSATLRFYAHETAWRGERTTFLARAFLAAIREIDPTIRPAFLSKTGTSDMNVVGPAWNCPILAYGPGDSTLDHTPHEHLPLADYWRAILVLEQALRNLPELL